MITSASGLRPFLLISVPKPKLQFPNLNVRIGLREAKELPEQPQGKFNHENGLNATKNL
jgi:hypothetical protein